MPLSDIVTITITTQNPGVTAAGFGVPLVAGATGWATPERTRTYNSIAGVVNDFAATTPEYQAMNQIFAQSPAPPTAMIGRLANKPTQAFTVAINTVVAVAGTAYKIRINNLSTGAAGVGIGATATFTTVGGDTNDSIITGLNAAVTALGLAVTTSITGAGGSHVLNITANVAGAWFGLEIFDTSAGTVGNLMTIVENGADPGVTADLTAIAAESAAWYGLILLFKSTAIVTAAATWTESNSKLFLPACQETNIAIVADGSAADIAHVLKGAARFRTGVFFHPRNDEFADAAQMARFFPIAPGGENWRLKTLSGVTPCNFTATQVTNMNTKYCNFYYILGATGGSVNVIGGNGKVSANEFIDVIRFRDWYAANLQADLANLLIGANKVPYTDQGIAQVEAIVRKRNKLGVDAGGISATAIPPGFTTPGPQVTVPQLANVSAGDKSTRTLNNVNSAWVLAGAINAINVNVQVTH